MGHTLVSSRNDRAGSQIPKEKWDVDIQYSFTGMIKCLFYDVSYKGNNLQNQILNTAHQGRLFLIINDVTSLFVMLMVVRLISTVQSTFIVHNNVFFEELKSIFQELSSLSAFKNCQLANQFVTARYGVTKIHI